MAIEYAPRLFGNEAEVVRLGEGLCACTLCREDWTHEAHLASTLYLIVRRPDIVVERDLPGIIRRFNESVGGVNDGTQGYHETITQSFIAGIRQFLASCPEEMSLLDQVNGLLQAPQGHRDWPLRFYSKDRLFSVEARLGRVTPDLMPLPGV
jgi:hypothetical protein